MSKNILIFKFGDTTEPDILVLREENQFNSVILFKHQALSIVIQLIIMNTYIQYEIDLA